MPHAADATFSPCSALRGKAGVTVPNQVAPPALRALLLPVGLPVS